MKTWLCAALLGLTTLVTFFFQKAKLETLRQETRALETSVRGSAMHQASPAGASRRSRDQAADAPTRESLHRLKAVVDLSFNRLLKPGWSGAQHDEFEQIRNTMILHLVKINHHSAFSILNQSLEISDLSPEERDRLIEGYVRIYIDAHPLEALRLFDLLPVYPAFTKQLTTAYLRSAIASPGHAVAWFEEQIWKGNPIAGNPEIIRASLTAQSRIDPTRAVVRMAELVDPEAIKSLGHALVIEFRNTAEHLAFARALENGVAINPTSSSLIEVRANYVKSLVSRLEDWPFEDASLLIDGCLTPEESKLLAARELLFFEKDRDAGKWAGWLASMEGTASKTHPLAGYVGRWALTHPDAAMNWLENHASGTARERGVIGFANFMAEKDPRNGMRLLHTLPASEERSTTIQRVRERWRKVDPAAEAGYHEGGMPE